MTRHSPNRECHPSFHPQLLSPSDQPKIANHPTTKQPKHGNHGDTCSVGSRYYNCPKSQHQSKNRFNIWRLTSKAASIFDFLNPTCSPLVSRSYAIKLYHLHNLCHPSQYPNGLYPFCNALATLMYGTQIFGGFLPSNSWIILTLNYPHPLVFQSGRAFPRSSTNEPPPPFSSHPPARVRT